MKHLSQSYLLDSTRWDRYEPRGDDIIIGTAYKAGTTWMQNIVRHLVFLGKESMPGRHQASPWLDNRVRPIEEVMDNLQAQEHRRFIKTHLPLDGLPFHPEPKYIVVGRDARDVFMSMWNHYSNFTPEFYQSVNEPVDGRVGEPIPQCPPDIGTFWYRWITQGWFEWEREGYPFWSNLGHVQSWWDFRDLPNMLFVHFADLLEDLPGEILRVAEYLDMDVSQEQVRAIANATSFASMKANAEELLPNAGLPSKVAPRPSFTRAPTADGRMFCRRRTFRCTRTPFPEFCRPTAGSGWRMAGWEQPNCHSGQHAPLHQIN